MAAHENHAKNAETAADARQRAARTLWQGVLIDVLTAVVLAASVVLSADVEWTSAYWSALGLLAAKTALQALVSAVSRYAVPPRSVDS